MSELTKSYGKYFKSKLSKLYGLDLGSEIWDHRSEIRKELIQDPDPGANPPDTGSAILFGGWIIFQSVSVDYESGQ